MRAIGFFIKCLFVIVIILAITSYVTYLRTGQFWVPNISINSIQSTMPSFKKAPVMQTLQAPDEDVYKWRENGKWVYGNKPPAGVNAQVVNQDD